MSTTVKLVGLDFGTTTSSAVIAEARLSHNAVTSRTELGQVQECFRSEIVFTPYREDRLDEERLQAYVDHWLSSGGVRPEEVFGGGALLTGLAAQAENAAALVQLVRRRLKDALIATADDPCLESWLAFMGSCAGLSRACPDRFIVNLDIGGGTTNPALGRGGEVLRTGCLFVGARHIQVEPGTYRIVKLSAHARNLLEHFHIRKGPGDTLTEADVGAVLGFYMDLLEAALGTAGLGGLTPPARQALIQRHEQVPFRMPPEVTSPLVTLSGGVGELVYAHGQGRPWPPTTHFGDLGIDLAQRLVRSRWTDGFRTFQPASAGRATVYGLLRHTMQVSGSTLFLPRPDTLPLTDLPILGRIAAGDSDLQVRDRIELVRGSPRGGCLLVTFDGDASADAVRRLGQRIASALRTPQFPPESPLVLLVRENVGKVLGHYVSEWGALPVNLVVIDEIAVRNAQYVQIGALQNQVAPLSFYGLWEDTGASLR